MLHRFIPAAAALLGTAATLVLAAPRADADTLLILVSEDTSPYSFLPSLIRYNNPSAYAFRGDDEGGTQHEFETFLWFDVGLSDLPAGHVLTGAELLVTWDFDAGGFGSGSTDPAELNCHEVIEDWDQTTLNWNNRPAIAPAFDGFTGLTTYTSVVCDVWPLVFDWIHDSAPNYGLALTNDTDRPIGMHTLEADPSIPDALKANLVLTTELPEPGLGVALAFGTIALTGLRRNAGR